MTRPQDHAGKSVQPPLAEMVRNYLQRHAALAAQDPSMSETFEEVVPFDASALPPIDARRAWDEARACVAHFNGTESAKWQMPPDWNTLVASCEPTAAVPFALGNSPQIVRNVQPLLRGEDLATLRPGSGRPVSAPALLDWVEQIQKNGRSPDLLVALSALRLGRHFDLAASLVEKYRNDIPAQWQALWANEEAALAWQSGHAAEAMRSWEAQEPRVPLLFNLGMAKLFNNQPAEAKTLLSQAVGQLPEADVWHHLGCLYVALADLRA